MSDLVCPRLTPLEILSRNLRFPKAEDAKPRKIRYVFVALEFGHSKLEILLRVMQKLGSYGRLSGRYSSSCGRSTFASYYNNSGALLTNYATSRIARNIRQKRAPEYPRGVQRGKKKQEKRR